MNTSTKAIIGFGLIAAMVFYQIKSQLPKSGVSNDEINAKIVNTKDAFDKAESSILGVNPTPEPDTPLSPDPDPEKCICQGTGQYERPDAPGSGKMVECPFHGSSQLAPVEPNIQYFEPKAKIYVYPKRQGFFNRLFFN
jgi:hypothetical protein